jgi:nucleotide-binding universal stress UspA family protein
MYKAVVVGTDGSPTANRAVTHAAGLAAQYDASLHLVHAYRPPDMAMMTDVATMPLNPAQLRKEVVAHAEQVCEEASRMARDLGAKVETHLVPGDAAEALISVAEAVGADLLVVGNRGMSGMRRFLLGSVPNRVSHHAPCSLLILQTT